jgi:LuxR family transcriptional regulator, maltose regulon positive regulatory protein
MTRLPGDVPETSPRPYLPALTDRELQVVQLLARQQSTSQIAAAMCLSVNTVRTRARHAERKLGVATRDEATRTARDRGLI